MSIDALRQKRVCAADPNQVCGTDLYVDCCTAGRAATRQPPILHCLLAFNNPAWRERSPRIAFNNWHKNIGMVKCVEYAMNYNQSFPSHASAIRLSYIC